MKKPIGRWFYFENVEIRDRFLKLYGDLILNWHESKYDPKIIKTQLKAGSMESIKNGLGDYIVQKRCHIYVGNVVW